MEAELALTIIHFSLSLRYFIWQMLILFSSSQNTSLIVMLQTTIKQCIAKSDPPYLGLNSHKSVATGVPAQCKDLTLLVLQLFSPYRSSPTQSLERFSSTSQIYGAVRRPPSQAHNKHIPNCHAHQ